MFFKVGAVADAGSITVTDGGITWVEGGTAHSAAWGQTVRGWVVTKGDKIHCCLTMGGMGHSGTEYRAAPLEWSLIYTAPDGRWFRALHALPDAGP